MMHFVCACITTCYVTYLQLDDQELQNLALLQIEDFLQSNRSLRDYPPMSFPEGVVTTQLGNRLIYE